MHRPPQRYRLWGVPTRLWLLVAASVTLAIVMTMWRYAATMPILGEGHGRVQRHEDHAVSLAGGAAGALRGAGAEEEVEDESIPAAGDEADVDVAAEEAAAVAGGAGEAVPPPPPAQAEQPPPPPAVEVPPQAEEDGGPPPLPPRPRGIHRPPAPTPFPAGYVSKLARAAAELGITEVPDVFAGRRDRGATPCPPYAGIDASISGTELLQQVTSIPITLITVSYRTPASLTNSVHSWWRGGLLDLVDDAAMFLSAPTPEERELALSAGFKLWTSDEADIAELRARHDAYLSEKIGDALHPNWPHIQKTPDGKGQALWVSPSLMFSLAETAGSAVIFLEKDYALSGVVDRASLVRQLLAGVAMLASEARVVRIRRPEDPNRDAFPNCCEGACGGSYNGFSQGCVFQGNLNWLAMICDREGVTARSNGAVQTCLDERDGKRNESTPIRGVPAAAIAAAADAAAAAVEEGVEVAPLAHGGVDPIEAKCLSFDHSNWSNTASMWLKEWYFVAEGHTSVHSTDWGNMGVELDGMFVCQKQKRSQRSGDQTPHVCQMWPGLMVHAEIDDKAAGF